MSFRSCIGDGIAVPGANPSQRQTKAMIFPLFRRRPRGPDTISTLYGMIVAQARFPCFYRDYAVADTVDGRFDLIVLHLALVLDRMAQDSALQNLAQGLFDRFCQDMDHNLREMGIGDLKVPKEMRRMVEAYYGRARAYRAALAAQDNQELVAALGRNIYYGGSPAAAAAAPRLAAYMREALRDLSAQDNASLAAGALHFPDPASIPTTRR
jgi:cytochrome b pre-mRNA-processing protein 3